MCITTDVGSEYILLHAKHARNQTRESEGMPSSLRKILN